MENNVPNNIEKLPNDVGNLISPDQLPLEVNVCLNFWTFVLNVSIFPAIIVALLLIWLFNDSKVIEHEKVAVLGGMLGFCSIFFFYRALYRSERREFKFTASGIQKDSLNIAWQRISTISKVQQKGVFGESSYEVMRFHIVDGSELDLPTGENNYSQEKLSELVYSYWFHGQGHIQ